MCSISIKRAILWLSVDDGGGGIGEDTPRSGCCAGDFDAPGSKAARRLLLDELCGMLIALDGKCDGEGAEAAAGDPLSGPCVAAASAANIRANRDERGLSSTTLGVSFSLEDDDGNKKSAKTDFGGAV